MYEFEKSGDGRNPPNPPWKGGLPDPVPPFLRGVRGDWDLEAKSSRLVYIP